MKTSQLLTLAICLALTACTSTGEPKELNGRHRQPINVQPVATQPTAEVFTAAAGPATTPPPPPAPVAQLVADEGQTITLPCRVMAGNDPSEASDAGRVFRVFFDYGKATLHVPPAMELELLPLAHFSTRISIKGRTDGAKYSAGDETLAMRRALAMRAYLIGQGIDATRIDMEFASAADYLAENATSAGRDQNRRVEVVVSAGKKFSPAS